MQKIMFNDKFGLTQAVLEGRKTMTRRIVTEHILEYCRNRYNDENASPYRGVCWPDIETAIKYIAKYHGSYKVGEVVAIAQPYKDIIRAGVDISEAEVRQLKNMPGWDKKLFVRADLMQSRIRFTDIKVERLQDISDEDALSEGVRVSDFSLPQNRYFIDGIKRKGNTLRYKDEQGWHTFRWQTYDNAIDCFANLIGKVSGKGTWESNPWMFCYKFELVK